MFVKTCTSLVNNTTCCKAPIFLVMIISRSGNVWLVGKDSSDKDKDWTRSNVLSKVQISSTTRVEMHPSPRRWQDQDQGQVTELIRVPLPVAVAPGSTVDHFRLTATGWSSFNDGLKVTQLRDTGYSQGSLTLWLGHFYYTSNNSWAWGPVLCCYFCTAPASLLVTG